MSNPGLQTLYSFDEIDISYNRAGSLSPRQQQNKTQSQKSGVLPGIGCGIIFFAIAAIFPVIFVLVFLAASKDLGLFGSLGMGAGALFWLLVWGGIGVYNIRNAISKPNLSVKVLKAEGAVNLVGVRRSSGGKTHHYYTQDQLHIGGMEFDVDSEFANYVMQAEHYAVYYLENDNEIISLEQLSK